MPRPAEVWHLRAFVQLCADAVADKITHDRKSLCLNIRLHSARNIRNAVAHTGKFDTLIETLPGYLNQLHGLPAHLPAGDGAGAVAVKALDVRTNVHLYNVALMDDPLFGRDAVNDFIVDRYTGARRKAAVAEKGGLCPCVLDRLADSPVDVVRSNPRSDRVRRRLARKRGNAAGHAHQLQFFGCFNVDHRVKGPAPRRQTARSDGSPACRRCS